MNLKDLIPLPDLKKAKHVLCVQPHPDDNEIGAGGTIALLHSLGIKISYLTVSQGRGGSETLSAKDLVETRRRELEAAGRLLGASDFYFCDLEESHYPSEKLLCEQIVEVIRIAKPDIVMTVDPYLLYEAHPTHRKTGMAVLEACMFASLSKFPDPEALTPPEVHRAKAIALYGTAHPNTYIDIRSTYQLKLRAIREHRTQFDEVGFEQLKQYLNMKADEYGQIIDSPAAEAFKVLPLLLSHMMVESESY